MDYLIYFMSLGGTYYRNWKYQTLTFPACLAASIWLGLGQLDTSILDLDSKAVTVKKQGPRRIHSSGRCKQQRQLQHQYQVTGAELAAMWHRCLVSNSLGDGRTSCGIQSSQTEAAVSSPDRVCSVNLSSGCSQTCVAIVHFPSLLYILPINFLSYSCPFYKFLFKSAKVSFCCLQLRTLKRWASG